MNTWLPPRTFAAATAAVLALTACGGSGGSPNASGSTPGASGTPAPPTATSAPSAPSSPTPGTTTSPQTPAGPSATPDGTPPLGSWSLQPLWPFGTLAQAEAWQRSYRTGGHQPWHLDPGRTALAFTRDYLGFTEIDRVSSSRVSGRHARVGVAPTGSEGGTAAVIHLVRFGTGPDAPWEVVGTDDTTFSLTAPAYGALARSPLTAGGRITGVDESIHVQVRQPSSEAPLGTSACCTPAGGENQPWSVTVPFSGARDPVLTVVASTGGHVAAVERFTVTAVRTR
ncbi:hypothetical protein SSP531S_09880 [Streptomyces spongiicola]|uniref:Tat pathway signal sequence domain protein n=1 Tax=Streptomyces spongiicola TaxID=1690221 RepID=A0A388SU29_9ACTN|nr:hypothetical protein [Streptomyces spongiicola]GBP99593.1 hypothetical protein SSP531S_09880 [Streptomyces spongiicola]